MGLAHSSLLVLEPLVFNKDQILMQMDWFSMFGRTTPGNVSCILSKPVLYALLQDIFSKLIVIAIRTAEMMHQNLPQYKPISQRNCLIHTSLKICLSFCCSDTEVLCEQRLIKWLQVAAESVYRY